MKHRREYIEDRLTLVDSGTKTFDLDFVDTVSRLDITFRATNHYNHNKENPLLHNITKIELVDGGDVIISARGETLRGLFAHLDGRVPGYYQTEAFGGNVVETLPLSFGRFLYDTGYALNPVAFRNPQLKLTWDLGHIRTVGTDAYESGTLDVTIIARLMEDVPAPTAILTAKEVYDFTTADAGDERIPMPTDYPWRTLLVRAYENGTDFRTTINNIKLSCDGGKFLMFDERTDHLVQEQLDYYGRLENTRECVASFGDFVATYMGLSTGGQATGSTGHHFWPVSAWTHSDARVLGEHYDGTDANLKNVWLTDRGTGYENCILVPMGVKNDPTTWFNAQQYGSILLYLTQGDEDAECQVLVQEARPY